jgi:hypothetical protein
MAAVHARRDCRRHGRSAAQLGVFVAALAAAPPLAGQSSTFTTRVGGSGGQQSSALCGAGEVMVGIHGRYDQWLDRLGVRCVGVDVNGRWIGNPRNGPSRGGTGGNRSFSIDCSRDRAVVGMSGAAGWYVHRLAMRCQPLGANARTSGSNNSLAAQGASGGTSFAATTCNTDGRPADGFRVWSGAWVDAVQLRCTHRTPPPATLTRPTPGSTVRARTPSLVWRHVPLAGRYAVRIWSGTFNIDHATTDTTTVFNPEFLEADGVRVPFGSTVNWSVQSCNANGCAAVRQTSFTYAPPGGN